MFFLNYFLMIKSNLLILPFCLNIILIMIFMTPSKIINFNPMTYMILLILLTFSICLVMNLISKSWIPYILFLMMIGGLMIIFMYITSLSSNELFFMNYQIMKTNFFKIFFFTMIMIFLMIMFMDQMFFMLNLNFFNKNLYLFDQMNMNLLYKKIFNKSTMFIMIYLYYSMIIIMNICFKLKAPLRQIKF
uniref:NADH dehydrogenase subunit 6 n=1 Tax=Gotra octocincta TaxID=3029099 RepID=UPI0023D8BF40|nr:NADH dehydrogenase subunit 6 [Gotra octocincta]WDQ40361.1 NADH dehydrogenase subunit 6 [Gotra octocincta]